LASRGYTLGANLVVESRSTQGDPKRFPGLIEELTKIPVNLLVTLSYPAARAAKDRAPTLPIVVVGTGDPVESGLVVSLARPGGNMTGISDVAAELAPKRLELLKAAATGLKKVAMLWNADDLGMTLRYRATAAAAAALGVTVQSLGVREPDDFNEAFAAMDRDRPDGILMVSDALTFLNRKKVFEFAAPRHLPAIYELESWVRAGGLMSYGPDFHEVADRAAAQVDRILKGAKPADLPFEQPTRFRLVVNRKIADALGLAIPESFYARADEVIE
jgi:ABC-type uncharacterized transport system substrate-binding protein